MSRVRDLDEPVAALITINYETGEVMHTIYRGRDGYVDPVKNCEAMKRSVEDDWPDHDQHVIGNRAAWDATGKRRMKEWFGIEATDEQ